MDIYISDQLTSCLVFSVFGVICGLIYDILRTFRSLFLDGEAKGALRKALGRVLDFILDILFMLFVGVNFPVLAYCYSYGKPRLFNFICFALFFWLYKCTLGRLYSVTVERVILLFKRVVCFLIKLLLKPVGILIKLIVSFMFWVYSLTFGRLLLHIRNERELSHFNGVLALLDTDVRF